MKRIIPITLTLLLVFFATTALADHGQSRGNQNNYSAQGERIDRHLDHKDNWIRTRYSQHRHHNSCDHRIVYQKPRVTYRSHTHHNDRFGVVINQPGLWFGGIWHN